MWNEGEPIFRIMPPPKKPLQLIVRRGALRRFHKLKEQTASLPVSVMWDRREHDRRAETGQVTTKRRAKDRRQKAPFTWDVSDFVVVAKPTKRRKRR